MNSELHHELHHELDPFEDSSLIHDLILLVMRNYFLKMVEYVPNVLGIHVVQSWPWYYRYYVDIITMYVTQTTLEVVASVWVQYAAAPNTSLHYKRIVRETGSWQCPSSHSFRIHLLPSVKQRVEFLEIVFLPQY